MFGKKKKSKEKEGSATLPKELEDSINQKREVLNDLVPKEKEKDLYSKENLQSIKSNKDKTTEKNKKILPKVYDYWVYIMKDGKKINDFGVRLETFRNAKLLIRKQKNPKGEEEVVFAEIFPESKYDLQTIEANKSEIKKKLDKCYQRRRFLEKEQFSNSGIIYNYDITDLNVEIQELELMLDSVALGSKSYYEINIRDDGIPCFFYELSNSGLTLLKKVKDTNIIKEASEAKRIGTGSILDDINTIFPKTKSRDWLKLIGSFLVILLVGILLWGIFKNFAISEEKQYGEFKDRLAETTTACEESALRSQNQLPASIDKLVSKYDELLAKCDLAQSTRDSNNRAVVGG